MSRVRFLQLSALVPVLLPLVAGLAHLGIASLTGPIKGNTPLGMILLFLFAVPFLGSVLVAPAYLAFAATLLILLRGRPEQAYRKAAIVAPPAFAIVAVAYFTALGFGRESPLPFVTLTVTYSLLLGYASVGVAFVSLRVLSERGWVSAIGRAAS